jgi:hypothetical protein
MMIELSVSRGICWCLAVIMLSSTVFFGGGDAEFHGWSYIVHPKKVLVKRTCEDGSEEKPCFGYGILLLVIITDCHFE